MANTLTNLIPSVYAALDVVSRELTAFIPGVNRDFKADQVAQNQTLYVPVAPANTTGNITPAMTVTAASDQTIGTKSVTISNFKVASFGYTGEEAYSLDQGPGAGSVQQDQIEQCIRALANEMELAIWTAAYKAASRAYGTAGTTPFDSTNKLAFTANLKKILDDNGAPMGNRSLVIDTTAGAALRSLTQLTNVNEAGSSMTLRDGELLNVHGFSIKESAQVTTATAGTGASYQTNNASGYAIGDTTIALDTGSGTILAGDVITFTGDTNKYVVTTALSGGSLTIAAPGLRKALADNVACTVAATSTRNVAFSRNAILLAARLPKAGAQDLAIDRQVITDPRTGLSFELAMYPGYRMNKVEVAIAYGVSVIKPEHSAILLG